MTDRAEQDAAAQQVSDPDPASVRRGSRTVHRMAWLIFVYGVATYGFLAGSVRVLDALDSRQVVFASATTLPTDTALALLGLCATVVIALVAALWASGQVSDPALSRGRRRALAAVTTATGVGSAVVGAAGGLHRPDEGWNFVSAPAIVCTGLVLAYVAADVAFIMREDRALEAALRRQDADDRRARLWTARRNWLRLSRSAGWNRGRHPILDRLGQTIILLGLLAAMLVAVLAGLGRRALTGYLGWWFLDVAIGVLTGQLAAHFLAIKVVARRWQPLYWYCMYGLLYLPMSLLAQLKLWDSMEAELPGRGPDAGVAFAFIVACWLVPPLICLLGLTVVPRRWHRFRPVPQIRWSVIEAIGHEIDLIDRGTTASNNPRVKPSLASRLMRAIRRANGSEEIGPGAP